MNYENIPRHVAIIPDGNRRWAKAKGKPSVEGHTAGFGRIREMVNYARDQKISTLTIWAFSTENWKRAEEEVFALMFIIKRALTDIYNDLIIKKSRFVHIGRKDRLSKDIIELIETMEEETKDYTDFCLCIALDYGGEDEILRAEKKLLEFADKNKHIVDFLDSTLANIPHPDLIIRMGGEKRSSGFMPLQSAYSEWIFEDLMFPDFNTNVFKKCLDEYALRSRRFGQ